MEAWPPNPPDAPPEHADATDVQVSRPTMSAPASSYITFFDLPAEIKNQIISSMSYHDASSFRITCKTASVLIPFRHLIAMRTRLKKFLVAMEACMFIVYKWMHDVDLRRARRNPLTSDIIHEEPSTGAENLNCYACLKFLPREAFNSTQLRRSRGLGHKKYAKRFCIDCGWRKKIWERGSIRGRGKRTIIVCRRCGGLNRPTPDLWLKRLSVCSKKCLLLERAKRIRLEAERKAESSVRELEMQKKSQEERRLKEARHVWEEARHVWEEEREEKRVSERMSVITDKMAVALLTMPSRATRCQRCWAISHTLKPLSVVGSRLCTECEVEVGVAKVTFDQVKAR